MKSQHWREDGDNLVRLRAGADAAHAEYVANLNGGAAPPPRPAPPAEARDDEARKAELTKMQDRADAARDAMIHRLSNAWRKN